MAPCFDHMVDTILSLLALASATEPPFRWWVLDGAAFEKVILDAYEDGQAL